MSTRDPWKFSGIVLAAILEMRGSPTHGRNSDIFKESHKAEIHVEVLMAVKQSEPGIIGKEIDIHPTEAFDENGVFIDAGRFFPVDFSDLEIMPMQV